jgi:hypothetical protein
MDPELIGAVVNPPTGPDGQPVLGPDGNPIDPVSGQPHQPQPPMPANSWDNHPVHIQVHNQFRKTQQFELLPPEIKQAFELHVQSHQLAASLGMMGVGGNMLTPGEAPPVGPDGQAQAAPNDFAGEGGEPPTDAGPPMQ